MSMTQIIAQTFAVVWGHKRCMTFVLMVMANFSKLAPSEHDMLHNMQRHIEIKGNLDTLLFQSEGLVDYSVLQVL
jgi:hypothetical protein